MEAFIRFRDPDGKVHYGEVSQKQLAENLVGTSVNILEGTPLTGFSKLDETRDINEVSRFVL